MRWVLAASEVWLLVRMIRGRRFRDTPCLFGYVLFALFSAISYSPYNAEFTAAMSHASDWLKGMALLEAFVLLSMGMDQTDRTLSAAIGIFAASSVTASAYGLPSRVTDHMLTLIWLATAALAVAWWSWRRGQRIEGWIVANAWLLAWYLLLKAGAVVLWTFTKEAGWEFVNSAAMLLEAECFVLWAYNGPQETAAERDEERENGQDDRFHRLSRHGF